MATTVALAVVMAACGSAQGKPPVPGSSDPQVQEGYKIALKQSCFGCHRVGGVGGGSGPAFDTTGSTVQLADGSTVPVDDAYVRRSIQDPDSQIVAGYRKGIMTSGLSGRPKLTDDQVNALVAYLQSVKAKS